jgi:uncharacterized protein (DUF983 family)
MTKNKQISLVKSVVTLKCPRCRQGNLFDKSGLFTYKNMLKMPEKCPHCGQIYEIEPGFWIGALWVSYPIVVAIELPFLFAALVTTNYSPWLFFGLMLVAFVIFFPLILRLGRSIWIHISVRYDNSYN